MVEVKDKTTLVSGVKKRSVFYIVGPGRDFCSRCAADADEKIKDIIDSLVAEVKGHPTWEHIVLRAQVLFGNNKPIMEELKQTILNIAKQYDSENDTDIFMIAEAELAEKRPIDRVPSQQAIETMMKFPMAGEVESFFEDQGLFSEVLPGYSLLIELAAKKFETKPIQLKMAIGVILAGAKVDKIEDDLEKEFFSDL